ncbi:hypothetical protein [Acidithiobacillus ferridurans]|uniref:Uncharacterized protein n=1 Tax=Acidithiobacillus ferridurans TaxID=1232575 RepID=A0A8X8K9P3_ACIFI|nr:hypothetical protein [Acidithiobacillus ferridurans]MBU2716961.1 hypothetical protein [Acidithiobacillus ferridurans]MBU2721808.1 hypothetical protein [Acidithiobacillus ferridurans]MBU2726928.1 hypothetical protein [Acidithiobacillus ferridurans]
MEYFYRGEEEFAVAGFRALFDAVEPGDTLLGYLTCTSSYKSCVVKKKTKTQLTISSPTGSDIRVLCDGYVFGSSAGWRRQKIRTLSRNEYQDKAAKAKMSLLRGDLNRFNFTDKEAVDDETVKKVAAILGLSSD